MEEKFGHDDIRLEKITDGYAGRSCISAGKIINCTVGSFADCKICRAAFILAEEIDMWYNTHKAQYEQK